MNAFEKLNIQLFLAMLGILVLFTFLNGSAYAQDAVFCKSFYGEKELTIGPDHIAFHKSQEGRFVSSTLKANTRKKFSGLDKIVYVDGNKHKVHIENLKKLSENTDYLTITNQNGHKITYPLICKLDR
jgi:D-lyxose ketol-isomerase